MTVFLLFREDAKSLAAFVLLLVEGMVGEMGGAMVDVVLLDIKRRCYGSYKGGEKRKTNVKSMGRRKEQAYTEFICGLDDDENAWWGV